MVTSPYQPGFVSGIECKSLYEYFNTLVTSFARDTKTRNLWVFAGPSKIRNDFHPISPVLDHISQVSLEHVVMFLFFSRSCRYSSHFLGPIFPHLHGFPMVSGVSPWVSTMKKPGPCRAERSRSQAWRAALGRGNCLHLGRQPLRAAGAGAGAEGGERQVPAPWSSMMTG